MTPPTTKHLPLSADGSNLDDAPHLVGELAPDGSVAALKPDPFPDTSGSVISDLKDAIPVSFSHKVIKNDSRTNSASGLSETTSEEDYDNMKLDPSAIVGEKRKGFLTTEDHTWSEESTVDELSGRLESWNSQPRRGRRPSIPIKLEKTDKTGRYLLTSDDPDLREILRAVKEGASSGGKKRRAKFSDLIFTRQFTTFDRQNPASAASPFHGFFTLFWLSVAMFILKVAGENWRTYGSVFGTNEILHIMFHRDVIVLGLTDGVMCGGTIMGLFLQNAIARGSISWNGAGWVLQNIWQAFYIGAVIGWTFYREWPWTHTVFIVLHCIVMLMKQHSYAFYNGYLSEVHKRREILQKKLRQLYDQECPLSPVDGDATTKSFSMADLSITNVLTHRRLSNKIPSDVQHEKEELAKVASAIDSGVPLSPAQSRSFAKIMNWEIEALSNELNGKSVKNTAEISSYPRNLTVKNWAEYVVLPTLVYELDYPRQEKINWAYVAEKTIATFGIVGVMILVSQAYIFPVVMHTVEMRNQGWPLLERLKEFPWILSDLLFPFMMEYLMVFYLIWECILNVLAEVTRFADRGFYADWWNATSWDMYARDWNRPVHNFLLRHVYHSSISALRVSRASATLITFFLSACVHELVMWVIFKKLRGYLLVMQMMQLPLVMLSRTRLLKERTTFGNIFFWVGIFTGPSFLCSLYLVI